MKARTPIAPLRGKHVAIVALGPSLDQYTYLTRCLGGRHRLADEVWAINALGSVFQADRVFHMDDVAIQEIRAAARPDSNIAVMLEWLRTHPGPIYTSVPRPGYPGLVPFPLEDVANRLGYVYFNSTAAYAIAMAIFLGADTISPFGFDFTYPKAHDAEKGRACVEFWLGIAAARGIEIRVPETSTLMDACEPEETKPYGYDAVEVAIRPGKRRARITFKPRATLPTADQIEARYDHSKHPSPLVAPRARSLKPEKTR